MFGAPAASARAAEDGLPSDSAAVAYFSNGTMSFSLAPSATQSLTTQSYTVREAAMSEWTASLIGRIASFCTQR
ncbi:MAG: hypothetical protein H6R21_2567 [Proteobacteria bacterium]|nr:hypothetical protein [Pseudomonadota bacterium]